MRSGWISRNSERTGANWSVRSPEVETDSSGNSLVERQNALNEFVIQSRIRLGALQETFTTLDQFKKELAKARADLVPLQAPVFGIEALIGDVHAIRNLLVTTLCEIESSGDSPLSSRVEALAKSKRELEERITDRYPRISRRSICCARTSAGFLRRSVAR